MSRAELVVLFERLVDLPYGGNEKLWDEALTALNLEQSIQVAVAQVLGEGRWRHAGDPKAYVATAAWNIAKKLNLLNGAYKPDQAGRGTKESSVSELKPIRNANEERIPYAERMDQLQFQAYDWSNDLIAEIPEELRDYDPASPTRINWAEVVNRSVDDEKIRDYVFRVLDAREQGFTRDQLLNSAGTDEERRGLQAAWKWIERHAESHIRPVLRGDARSTLKPKASRPEGFISPAEALARLSKKHKSFQ